MSKVKLLDSSTASKILNGAHRVVPVDATWYMPNNPLNAKLQFSKEDRIKSSVFFDLDAVCCPTSKYPHMLPPHRLFDQCVGDLGIRSTDSVLVYDRAGIFSGPRAAWTFALYGHNQVYLLDHYKKFKDQFEVEKGANSHDTVTEADYVGINADQFAVNYKKQVIEFDELYDLVEDGELTKYYTVFDARSADRFSGKAPEPRPGLSSGHVPGALSLPFTKVLNADGHYKSADELAELFKTEFELDLRAPFDKLGIIVMCGTGVTAVILRLAIEKVNPDIPIRVYDGSWTEWAQRAPQLIEKDV